MRAPDTEEVPVAALDVACGPELEVLSTAALFSPPLHAAAPINGSIAAHLRKTRSIFSPLGYSLLRNQIILRRYYLPAIVAALPGIRELISPVERTLLSLSPEV